MKKLRDEILRIWEPALFKSELGAQKESYSRKDTLCICYARLSSKRRYNRAIGDIKQSQLGVCVRC